jgi:hypothetical protein
VTTDKTRQGTYSVSNLADLPDEPTSVTQSLANQLLDVLQNYGLTKVGEIHHLKIYPF